MSIDLRHGRWEDVLGDVECDALIADPPYSSRTHDGHDDGASLANRAERYIKRANGGHDRMRERRVIDYAHWTPEDVRAFVDAWAPRTRGWMCCMSDSDLCHAWRDAFEANGLTGFQPVPCVIPGMTVRMCGDGPSSWAVYLNVARPKRLSKWGTLPGAYTFPRGKVVRIGGKPLSLMRAIVRDYSREGDLVCDPCAGGATTLLAASLEGRRGLRTGDGGHRAWLRARPAAGGAFHVNAVVPAPEPFVCWACQRPQPAHADRVHSGDVVLCEPCNRGEPSPTVLAPPSTPEPEQTSRATPKPALEAASPADAAVVDGGACALPRPRPLESAPELSPTERPVRAPSEPREAAETLPGSQLHDALGRALRRHGHGHTTAEEYGLELRRIAQALDTLSVSVRGRG